MLLNIFKQIYDSITVSAHVTGPLMVEPSQLHQFTVDKCKSTL